MRKVTNSVLTNWTNGDFGDMTENDLSLDSEAS